MNRREFLKASLNAAIAAVGGVALGVPVLKGTRWAQQFLVRDEGHVVEAVWGRVKVRSDEDYEWVRFVTDPTTLEAKKTYSFVADFGSKKARIFEVK